QGFRCLCQVAPGPPIGHERERAENGPVLCLRVPLAAVEDCPSQDYREVFRRQRLLANPGCRHRATSSQEAGPLHRSGKPGQCRSLSSLGARPQVLPPSPPHPHPPPPGGREKNCQPAPLGRGEKNCQPPPPGGRGKRCREARRSVPRAARRTGERTATSNGSSHATPARRTSHGPTPSPSAARKQARAQGVTTSVAR